MSESINGKGRHMNSNGKTAIEEIAVPVTISPLRQDIIRVTVKGITPLIVHAWDRKARQMMLDAMQGKKAKVKKAKDPEAEFEASRYRLPDGRDGLPAVAFKSAIVGGARFFGKSVSMVSLKQQIFVGGEVDAEGTLLVPIEGDVSMREDCVRVGNGVADLRYRAMYSNWSATLEIQFLSSVLAPESVIALVEAGGMGGVGEWRPSAPKGYTGMYGRFVVDGVQ